MYSTSVDRVIIASLLGLTTLQFFWSGLWMGRQFSQLSLVIWLFFLTLLGGYSLLLRSETTARPLKKLHRWVYAQITGPRIVGLGCLFLGAYAVWYTQHVWGKWLIQKDFGSFFYRQVLLDQIFPQLVAYNPMLNGGYATTELLATGIINLFLLTYPLNILFGPEVAFKAQPLLLILLLPGLIYLSGRLVGFSRAESLFSSAFALVMTTIGHGGFLPAVRTGFLPFVFSCELAVIIFALSYRVFVLGKSAAWGIPLIILFGSLGSFHPLFSLAMGPVALAVVFCGRISRKQKIVHCALIGIGLLVINGSWISAFLSYRGIELIGEVIEPSGLALTEWLRKLARYFLGLQLPLVIASLIGLHRLLRVAQEPERRCLGGLLLFAIVYYVLLTSTGPYLFDYIFFPMRFVTPLTFFLSLALGPSWSAVHTLWTRMEKEGDATSYRLNAALALLMIFLCLPYSLYFMIFPTAPQTAYELVNWLEETEGDNGRVFFYGPNRRVLGGNVAFYQAKTQRSIIGSRYAREQIPARIAWLHEIGECLQKPTAGVSCKDFYNIDYVITFSGNDNVEEDVPSPKEGELNGFRLLNTIDSVHIYENVQPSSYFLVGQGHVKQHLNRIAVTAEPSDFVVLKLFWVPGLRTDPPLVLEPYRYPHKPAFMKAHTQNNRAFIKVHTKNQRMFEILYR